MAIEREKILDILSSVQDPRNGRPISTSGSLVDLSIDGKIINIKLYFPKITPEVKNQLNFACLSAIYPHYADAHVHVNFVSKEESKSNNPLPHIKNIVAVASGKGGVGKSTVSVNLAKGLLARGFKVGILDADLYGPSLPTMLGLNSQKPKMTKIHGQPKLVPLEKDGLHVISIGFIVEPEQAVILRGPRLAGIVKQFLLDCVWPELDYLIVDLPPGTGDIQLTLVQSVPLTAALVVTTPQQVAVADALKAGNMFMLPNIDVPILGIVENMSWFIPPDQVDKRYEIFGKGGGERLAKLIDSEVLGQLPMTMEVPQNADKGRSIIDTEESLLMPYLDNLLDRFIYKLELRNSTLPESKPVEMKN